MIRHKRTNSLRVFIVLLFVSGILQIDIFNISWVYLSNIMAFHILGAIIVFVMLIVPYTIKHSIDMFYIHKNKNKEGFILLCLVCLITFSGLYLFLIGNRGGDIFGDIAFYVHFVSSFFLVGSLFYHIYNTRKQTKELLNYFQPVILAMILFVANNNMTADELVSIKYDDNVSRYHSSNWTNSAKCRSCHTDIFDQWSNSNHKNLTSANPYYMVQEALSAKDMGEDFRLWCMQCHNPSAVTTKQRASSHDMNDNFLADEIFAKDGQVLLDNYKKHGNFRLEEGVSCVACHRISSISEKGNGSYGLNLINRKKYPFENRSSQAGQWLKEKFINAKPNIHKKSYSKEFYSSSKFCATCHDEQVPKHRNISPSAVGKKIVSTYEEWFNSPYNNPKDKTKHKSCIDCHMTNIKDDKPEALSGRSTNGGKIKDDVKVHYFSGANHFLSGLKSKEHEEQTIALLKTSAKLDVSYVKGVLKIKVKNTGAGHHLPTGVADFRQLWLDIEVVDNDGKIIFTSGKLEKNGNLSKDARIFNKVFGDKDGKPVGLRFWRYEKLLKDTRIPAGKYRVESFDIGQTNPKYPLTITVKLNFRIYDQWITTAVQKAYPALPSPPVVELIKIVKTAK